MKNRKVLLISLLCTVCTTQNVNTYKKMNVLIILTELDLLVLKL